MNFWRGALRVEGELTDHQQFPAAVGQRQIHPPLAVVENTQTGDLPDQEPRFFFGILTSDAEKDQKTAADLAGHLAGGTDGDLGPGDSLNTGTHIKSRFLWEKGL